MALVSPGIEISISDQSQYVNSNIGSVPLIVLATAQDKTYNGAAATGTSKANAGKLMSFTSQRDLVTSMGTPTFQLSSAGTPIHGDERNEYGLMTAYSSLGLGNQLYAIRADIDLAQLAGTAVRPFSNPTNNTYWLDTVNTQFGIYELQPDFSLSNVTPTIITDANQVETTDLSTTATTVNGPSPIKSVGTVGSYALVMVNADGTTPDVIRLFYKADAYSLGAPSASLTNTWLQVGSAAWQTAVPIVTGSATIPAATAANLTITFANYSPIVNVGSTLAAFVNAINVAMNTDGVYAASTSTGALMLFVTSAAKSGGTATTADGKITLTSITYTATVGSMTAGASAATAVGIAVGRDYLSPKLGYGSYTQVPTGGRFLSGNNTLEAVERPSGSIFWKTSSIGAGWDPVLRRFETATNTWVPAATPMYSAVSTAIYSLDPAGGGVNIADQQTIALNIVGDYTANSLKIAEHVAAVSAIATSGPITGSPFTISDQFQVAITMPGSSGSTVYTVTLTGVTSESFVSDLLAEDIPYLTAQVNTLSGSQTSITITHTSGGQILLTPVSGQGTPISDAEFVDSVGSGFVVNAISGVVVINNWSTITSVINYQASAPYVAPATGTYWYYSNATEVDILINDNGAWKGYKTVASDARGFNLTGTDANGVIMSAGTPPTSQSSGNTALVSGDLWLDTSDLVNYPSMYRYNAGTAAWTSIDNTDHVGANGIVFADARWDADGTTDVISAALPSTASLLTVNNVDLDAPNALLYPRGTLLFNTRRSGYNVKRFVSNYFNETSFPNVALPQVADAWVSASGLDSKGVMQAGSHAQRSLIVSAMQSALDSNLEAREDIYSFNLLACPGYFELTSNLITLNNDRSNTGFIIGDTPMTLVPNAVAISNWVNNTDGDGLPSNTSSDTYTALYYPSGLTNDLSGNIVAVPASHAALRTFLYNDNVAYPWFAPAGVHRGLVSNLNDIGYIDKSSGRFIHNGVNQGLRDALYTLAINPITQLPGVGIVVWGEKTRSGSSTSRDRVNVVRLENYLRTIFKSVSNGYLFEPNDTMTRKSIASQIESALHDVLSKRGIYDFLVICDTSNNTPSTIANNQLYVDVAIEPMRDVEFIYIPIALFNPGAIAGLQVTSS